MNAKQMYLAWLRQTAPQVYVNAIRNVTGKKRSNGGLSRNLVASMASPMTGFGFLSDDYSDFGQDDSGGLQEITVTGTPVTQPSLDLQNLNFTSPDLTNLDVGPLPTISSPDTSGGTDWFSSLTKAVTGLATTALNVNTQSNLLKVNTTRAQQGLPPVNAQGVPIQSSMLSLSSNPALRSFETSITSGGAGTWMLLGGIGLIALLILKK